MALPILTRMLKQTCVYWPPAAVAYDEFGRPLGSTARELACRWEDTAKQFVDAQGMTRVSSARVFVAEDLAVGGRLYLGSLDDLDSDAQPEDVASLEIQSFQKIPDLRAKNTLRIAML